MAENGRIRSDAETKLLLEIWSQDNIQKQLQGSFNNVNVFSKLVEELRRSGYHRTVSKYRIKIKRSGKDIKKSWTERGGVARETNRRRKTFLTTSSTCIVSSLHSQINAVVTNRPSVTPVHQCWTR